jgi:hypothetical protein
MNCLPWPSFDPKLTGDGLQTFFGAPLAFLPILQVRHADKGSQKQREERL